MIPLPSIAVLRVCIVVALAAACFGTGWTVQGWRLGTELADLKAAHAGELAAANGRALGLQQQRDGAREAQGQAQGSISAEALTKLQGDANETNRLRRCVAAGTCGVRVAPGFCPQPSSNMPGTGTSGSMDTPAGAGLTAEAEQDYFDFRASVQRVQAKLTACQKAAAIATGQTLPGVVRNGLD